MIDVRDFTYSNIPSQFPSLYREGESPMLEFVKQYYKWLEEKNDRNIPKIRDIDNTYEEFLLSFKEKYLKDFPINRKLDTRFIIKHITDLYRTKGSEEGLRILFRLFFNEEIEVFYPSSAVVKPSDSIWSSDTFLEMRSISNPFEYSIQRGDLISGDVSRASALVDQIIFIQFYGKYTPIIYISSVSGVFRSDDSIRIDRQGQPPSYPGQLISGSLQKVEILSSGREPNQKVGDKVNLVSRDRGIGATGTVTKISDTISGRIEYELLNSGYGYVKSGFPVSLENEIIQNDQVVIIENGIEVLAEFGDKISATSALIEPVTTELIPSSAPFLEFTQDAISTNQETISFPNRHGLSTGVAVRYSSNGETSIGGLTDGEIYYIIRIDAVTIALSETPGSTTRVDLTSVGADITHRLQTFIGYRRNPNTGDFITTITGQGTILSVDNSLSIIYFKSDDEQGENLAFDPVPDNGRISLTVTFSDNTTQTITTTSLSERNTTASFDIEIGNTEVVNLILDTIEPYLDVRLDSGDYGMSGTGAESINTKIVDAFSIYQLELGEITKIVDPDPGENYQNSVDAFVRQPEILQFNKTDAILTFKEVPPSILIGTEISQDIQVPNYDFDDTIPESATNRRTLDYTTKGILVKRVGNNFYFKQTRFYNFVIGLSAVINGQTYTVKSVSRDPDSLPMGLNVDIESTLKFESGQIDEIRIDNSGYKYKNEETLEIQKVDNGETVATAKAIIDGIGKGLGEWKTKTSILNDNTRAIHDNFYYQEYSFDVGTGVPPRLYENLVKDLTQVTGTKLFSTPLINSETSLQASAESEIVVVTLEERNYIYEDENVAITEDGGFILTGTVEQTSTNVL